MRPEVNDEVVVAFDRGDTRQAVVLGGLWSAKNKPAVADAELTLLDGFAALPAGDAASFSSANQTRGGEGAEASAARRSCAGRSPWSHSKERKRS